MNVQGLMVVSLLCVATIATAHEGATGVVKQRMDQMKAMETATKSIGAMMKGAEPFDQAQIHMLSMKMSGQNITTLFPHGSLHKPSEADPRVWVEWETFEQQATGFQRAAMTLAQQSQSQTADPETLESGFRDLVAACKSCHKRYRAKK